MTSIYRSLVTWCGVPKRAAVNDHTRNYLSWTPIHVHHHHHSPFDEHRGQKHRAIKHLIQRSRPQSDIVCVCVCVGRGSQGVATWVAGCTAKKFFYKKGRKMSGPESSMYKYSWRHREMGGSIRQMLRNMMLSRSISLVKCSGRSKSSMITSVIIWRRKMQLIKLVQLV